MMFMSSLAIPSILISIPLFSSFVELKLTGSILTLILIYICTYECAVRSLLLNGLLLVGPKRI
ncbi:hypothetical protein [Paenibacillus sp. OV219]|uniref:hypothetical protein n=1 Tax=Paenibacillus sp. OV219 TaxID=1884377 RepID=UPI0008B8D049|nr:hypothetical protein [Paenibacillus sp. OV219]SEM87917.1 hypothetical protein SAMN05518847_1011032 [Paenibacillus sp. OV219]